MKFLNNSNKYISKFLNFGHGDLFEIKNNKISPPDHPEQQVSVVVKIKIKEKRQKANRNLG
jgi:hypothetical protein